MSLSPEEKKLRHNEVNKRWRERNKDQERERRKRWFAANKDKHRVATKNWHENNKARHKELIARWDAEHPEMRRKYAVANKYGVKVQQIDALRAYQNHKCAACLADLESGRKVHLDHCHDTNFIRGLLCADCNCNIKLPDASVELLLSIVAYKKAPPAQKLFPGLKATPKKYKDLGDTP